MSHDHDARLTRLEMRLTEQERVIEDLNLALTAQWRSIDALRRHCERLAEQVEQAGAAAPGGTERPPHY